MNELLTPRLILAPLAHGDAPFIMELVNSPGWLQYIGDRHVHSMEDAIAYLDNGPLKSYRENGFGLLRVSLRDSGTPIGMCGLLRRPELDGPDIGFAFLPAYHRQGYAAEAVKATLTLARETLHLPEVLAIVQADNEASIGLLVRNGFLFDQVVISGAKMEPLRLYRRRVASG
jgi:RimJ/RimL family protein N-acetyltransferase